ncbi:MAG: hypothetical protein H0A75_01635 [Candidatus Methanofishera endochildressiae]|uniref:Uncharacterized protein n=1 Tax=Candidatus Methanofishera endochildressiae TaxID=2738884 RepID=A0A7Z0SD97_9GAMM|nr:hypothetical protein [Candidatus Methanofishera endochildressiae]
MKYKGGNVYEEEQTTQWPKEKVQKDNIRSTKPTYKTKDYVTLTPAKVDIKHKSINQSINTDILLVQTAKDQMHSIGVNYIHASTYHFK